ncbi:MAG: hypothetical protein IKI24_03805, partial [Clostridia bacterium]|nr:hypothetical protein [Clostridia bacterium]
EDDDDYDEDDVSFGQNLLSILKGVAAVVLLIAVAVVVLRIVEAGAKSSGGTFNLDWFRDHLGAVGRFLFPAK